MKQKWSALLIMCAFVLGFHRSTNQPFRFIVARNLLKTMHLKDAQEIRLNTRFVTIKQDKITRDITPLLWPISDAEREFLKAVIILYLPVNFHVEEYYEPDCCLAHQLTHRFVKTEA